MIVQYIIDWGYIRREVANASSEGLMLINQRLREIKKAIEKNGVLFLDVNRLSIRELNEIIRIKTGLCGRHNTRMAKHNGHVDIFSTAL